MSALGVDLQLWFREIGSCCASSREDGLNCSEAGEPDIDGEEETADEDEIAPVLCHAAAYQSGTAMGFAYGLLGRK